MADFAGVDEPIDVIDFDRWLLHADRRQMVHRALMELSEQRRRLIEMLFADPAPSYSNISASLAIPIGSIGPTRQRLLGKLRGAMSETEGLELAGASPILLWRRYSRPRWLSHSPWRDNIGKR